MTKRIFFLFSVVFTTLAAPYLHAQTELIGNGGFENGPANPSPWVLQKSIVSNDGDANNGRYAHTGSYFMWLGGLTNWSDDAYQTITLPSGLSSATLSFYYMVNSADDPNTAYDFLTAEIRDTNGTTLATVGNWSNMDADSGLGSAFYHYLTFNLLPYSGQTIQIYFSSQNDNLYETSLFVDDVSVTTTLASGPADLTPQNVSVSPTTALAGGSVTVNYTVANVGGTTAPASHTKVVIKDSVNNVFAQQTFATAALGSGATTNESHAIGLAGATAGSYNVYVTVDANSEVTQTNTSNDTSAAVPLTVQTPAGLVIIPIFDSSITNDPNSATIQSTINAAIQQYEGLFSDPITVTIQFSKMSSGLGLSSTYINTISYSSFLTALNADAKTTNDAVALAHLSAGPNNPVNGNSSVVLTTANLRALGLSGAPPAGQPDSTVSLNLSIMNLTRSSIDPNKYDLMAVAEHEIDEALGLGSTLNLLTNGAPTPTTAVHVMDLFRYDQNGARSFNTTAASQVYFSLDGVTDLVRFNQQQNDDYQDWYSPGNQTPRVQDAIGTPGSMPDLGVELIALDASGYNLVSAVPQPKIINTVNNGNSVTLTWTSQANLKYQLQYKTNLTQVGWSNLGSAITASGSTTGTSDTISATQRYYRINVLTATSSIVQKTQLEPVAFETVTNYFRPL